MNPVEIPLLRDILLQQNGQLDPAPLPPITLGMLAKELNVPIVRISMLVEGGWLHRAAGHEQDPLTSSLLLRCPPPTALSWLRQFFLPPQAKPLFTAGDILGLLEEAGVGEGVEMEDVARLAAGYGIPCQYDPALGGDTGLLLSWQSARKLVLEVLAGGRRGEWEGRRYDRQAVLWFLLQQDPAQALHPPSFIEQLEEEVARVANLPEPQRTIRAEMLLEQWKDAREVVNAFRNSVLASSLHACVPAPACADDTSHTPAPALPAVQASLERAVSALQKLV